MHERVPQDERRRPLSRAGAVALPIGTIAASLVLAKTGRDALFFVGRGVETLPLIYTGIALLAFPIALAMLSSVRVFGSRTARPGALAAAGVGLLVFQAVAKPGAGSIMSTFFLLVPLVYGVLFSATWLLAAELLDEERRDRIARTYAAVGAAAIGGAVAGGLIARALATSIPPQGLLALGGAFLLVAAALVLHVQRLNPPRPLRDAEDATPPRFGWEIARDRYGGRLMLVASGIAAAGVFVEFRFYLAAERAWAGSETIAQHFATIYLALHALALLLQWAVLPRLQARLGVFGVLLATPLVLLGGAAGLFLALAPAPALLRAAEGGLKATFHRAAWEQAFLPLRPSLRAGVKLLIDGVVAHLAEGVAAVFLWLWLRYGGADAWLAGAIVVALAVVLLAGRRLAGSLSESARKAGAFGPPIVDACAVTAVLGQSIQRAECQRRFAGPSTTTE